MTLHSPATLNDLQVETWLGEDGVPVVQIDTSGEGRFRVNVNDGPIWDQSSEEDSPSGRLAKAEKDKHDLVDEGLRLKNRAHALSSKARRLEVDNRRLAGTISAVESVRDDLLRRAASVRFSNPMYAAAFAEAAEAISTGLASDAPFVLPTTAPAKIEAKDKAEGGTRTFTLITDGRDYRAWLDERGHLWPEDVVLGNHTDHRLITDMEADRG